MLRFALRRFAMLVPTLIGLSILLFIWVRALPGDPARSILGQRASDAAVERVTAKYGFDKPLIEQYFTYIGRLLRFDFGDSIQKHESVLSAFNDKFPATLELTLAAMLLAIVVGIPLGYLAGRRTGGWLDTATVSGSLIGVVTPVFFIAVLLKYLFSIRWGWLPTAGREDARAFYDHPTGFYVLDGLLEGSWNQTWDAIKHLILPGVALGTIPLAIIVRITRAAVADVVHEDYVRTAMAKGLNLFTVARRHILRNALLPVVTTIGLQLGLLMSGAVLTESIFAIDGLGSYVFDGVSTLDYPVLQGFIFLIAVVFALITLLVDLTYGVIDPRVRTR